VQQTAWTPWVRWAPPVMSALALGTLMTHLAVNGASPQPDEGAAAHLWQLLVAGQLPIIGAWFVIGRRHPPTRRRRDLLGHLVALALAVAPVAVLGL
jgi:hypothetical protein